MKIFRYFLLPFSLIYGIVVFTRNYLFDIGKLKSSKFSIPIIGLGNLTTGGTGKTPHTEYIASLLKSKFKVATLSRGYKRKTRGFYIVEATSKVAQVGDEPLQMKLKFNELTVAVDANRRANSRARCGVAPGYVSSDGHSGPSSCASFSNAWPTSCEIVGNGCTTC